MSFPQDLQGYDTDIDPESGNYLNNDVAYKK